MTNGTDRQEAVILDPKARFTDFPQKLTFKIIIESADGDRIRAEILGVARKLCNNPDADFTGTPRPSRSGRYVSLDLELDVADTATFDALYRELSTIAGVMHVL